MSNWNKTGLKITNDTDVIKTFLEKTGATVVNHFAPIFYGSPDSIEFLESVTIIEHVYSTGDRLSKLAHEHYGDAKLWWVLAWFNCKPTDHHCRPGDTIRIPFPLPDVLQQAYDE